MNRRAQLQRKLAETPAPKPPAGLAERIKNDIPQELRFDAEEERERFGDAIGLNMRIAASILVLIATAFLALRVASRAPSDANPPAALRAAKRAVDQTQTLSSRPEPEPAVLQMPESKGNEAPAAPQRAATVRRPKRSEAVRVSEAAPPAEAIVPPPAAATASSDAAPSAPVVAAAPEFIKVTGSAKQAAAMKGAAEQIGVNDDSLVRRYAAPAALPAGVALDVEATEDPLTPGNVVVRVSLDAGSAASNAGVDVMLTPPVANSGRWLAGSWSWSAEHFAIGSRTTIVAFPMPHSDEALVQIRARYTDASGATNMEKMIRRSDVVRWNDASPRMKAVTLAALWQQGAPRKAIVDAARAAGLDALAAEIERR